MSEDSRPTQPDPGTHLLKPAPAHGESQNLQQQGPLRWVVLALASTLLFGNYWAYDLPASLYTQLQRWLEVSDDNWAVQQSVFYSVYSFPNMIIPLFGGTIYDKLGARWMLLSFGGAILLGQVFFSIGCQEKSYALMVIGRTLFGLGGESLSVGQTIITARWFAGKELSFALGINLTVARLGTVCNDNFSPWFAQRFDAAIGVWMGTLVCGLCGCCTVLLTWIDANYYKGVRGGSGESDVKLSDLKLLGSQFWLVLGIVISVYGVIVPFHSNLSVYMQRKWGYSEEEAGSLMGISDLVAAATVVAFGLFADKMGRRAMLLTLSCACLLGSQIFLAVTTYKPIGPLVVQGLGQAAYAAVIWPAVALVTPGRLMGTAMGIAVAALNAALFVFPWIVGVLVADALNDDDDDRAASDFNNVNYFFAGLGAFGLVIASIVWARDQFGLRVLHNKSTELASESSDATVAVLSNADERSDKPEAIDIDRFSKGQPVF